MTFASVFVIIIKRVTKAKALEIPDWIDVQLIHKHTTARTGINLKDIKKSLLLAQRFLHQSHQRIEKKKKMQESGEAIAERFLSFTTDWIDRGAF